MLVAHGVRHVVVCPGSRNAAIVHNFSVCPDLECHPATDERSAGFIALGLRQQQGGDVAVCVTSGSALLNLMPAVAEATYQQRGIIVISADRPQMWIDQLDGQTIPQPDVLGRFVGKAVNLPEPSNDDERWYCERLINEAFLALRSAAHPSVHINVPITEPLFDFSVETLPRVKTINCKNIDIALDEVMDRLASSKRPLLVMGQMNRTDAAPDCVNMWAEYMPVLSEQLSTDGLTYTDQMLYCIQKQPEKYKPDCVVYIGGHTVSKRLRQFLRTLNDAYHIVVSPDGTLRDVSQHTDLVVQGEPGYCLKAIGSRLMTDARMKRETAYNGTWSALRTLVAKKHEAYEPGYSQMFAVKLFENSISPKNIVYYANSMSVRLAMLYADHYVHCNRGVNGIEGCLSVAVGAALAAADDGAKPLVYCVSGDLAFFYDENALWQQQLGSNLRILLLNNGQGGIFRNLKGLQSSPACDSLVAARHNATAEGVCMQFGVEYHKATDEASLRDGLTHLHGQSERPVLLEVLTDIDEDERVFKEYYHALREPQSTGGAS